jgi:hypothetical protein
MRVRQLLRLCPTVKLAGGFVRVRPEELDSSFARFSLWALGQEDSAVVGAAQVSSKAELSSNYSTF